MVLGPAAPLISIQPRFETEIAYVYLKTTGYRFLQLNKLLPKQQQFHSHYISSLNMVKYCLYMLRFA